MNDTTTIAGNKNGRADIDTFIAFIAGDLNDTEEQQILDDMGEAYRAGYTDEELARIEAENTEFAKQSELVERRRKAREDNPCRKCGGSGELPHFHHIQNGTCFRCDGLGIDPGASYGGEDIIG